MHLLPAIKTLLGTSSRRGLAMPLTIEQESRAQAWAKVFEDGPATTAVLDDMQEHAAQLSEPLERAGAMTLILLIRRGRSQRGRKKGKNTRVGHEARSPCPPAGPSARAGS